MNKYSDWLRSQAKEHGYCADEWPDTRQGKISAVIAVKSAEAADAFDALLAACQAAVADGRTIMEVKKMAGVAHVSICSTSMRGFPSRL